MMALSKLFCLGVIGCLILVGCGRSETIVEVALHPTKANILYMATKIKHQMGASQYNQMLSDPTVVLSKDAREIDPVKRVAARIIEAAKRSKYGKAAKSFDWEVTVIKDDNTKNAWALPGGKIAVYTGIFPMAKDEAGLAAIMGHEVIHALAQHGGERMSQNVIAQAGLTVSNIGLAILGVDPTLNQVAMQVMGAGVQTGILLPFSRNHESEADYVGILLAADAGYDPREAVHIWERMAAAFGGAPPEFLSTHPAHETRITDLKGWMPEALALYERASKASVKMLPLITASPSPSSSSTTTPKKGARFR